MRHRKTGMNPSTLFYPPVCRCADWRRWRRNTAALVK